MVKCLPLDDPMFPFHLCDIQVCHMETELFLHPLLDFFVCSTILETRHVHVFEIEFNSDILTRYVSLGKRDNRLHNGIRLKQILQIFLKDYYFIRSIDLVKSLFKEKPDCRIINGDVIV